MAISQRGVPIDDVHQKAVTDVDLNPQDTASILVIDDDPVVRSLLRATLESDQFTVSEASDGVEGYEKCLKQRPDLLLADLIMPRMDGYELCRELRSNPDSAYVP